MYIIVSPTGRRLEPPRGRCWGATEPVFKKLLSENRIYFPRGGDGRPRVKQFEEDNKGLVPSSLWLASEVGDNEQSKKELMTIFSEGTVFDTPKPVELVRRIIEIASDQDSICLDSFAGSGTTAQAVLAQNFKDKGQRKFILVEAADYSDHTTAERTRRVIKGVPNAKDESLKSGFGGSFTYCQLGEPIDLERFFDGRGTPSYEQVARYVVYTATGQSVADVPNEPRKDWFIAEAGGYRIHLIYRPDLAFMRTNDAALSMPLAQQIAKSSKAKPVLVYAAAKFMAQAALTGIDITFCQLPYSIHRVLGEAPDAP
jgi:adenine-specific DNA-methyltransferase